MFQKIATLVVAAFVGLSAFTATAFAAGAVTGSEPALIDLARPVLEAVMHGSYAYAAVLALVFAVTLLRRYGSIHWEWVESDAGGALLALLTSLAGALATAAAAGAAPSWALVWTSVQVAAGASGVYVLAKHLLAAPLRWLRDRLPARLRFLVDALLWLFSSSSEAKAAAAGEAAVAANPGPGLAGIVGDSRDLP